MAKKKSKKRYRLWIVLGVVACVVLAGVYSTLFTAMTRTGSTEYVYIDNDDNIDSVLVKVKRLSTTDSYFFFRKLMLLSSYSDHIIPGRYRIGKEGALQTFRHISNGAQAPVSLTIKSVRTLDKLTDDVSSKMMMKKADLLKALSSEATCKKYGYTPETIICMFLPNTYDFYWDISVDDFLQRMKKESDKFWTQERKEKADQAKLTPCEVITLASIVDEETDNEAEMPKIAGMYINRLNIGMRLQADPTVKYATKNFTAHRIYEKWLSVDSPYNTYRNKGLPPGPIRIPSVAAIDAVLNYVHHDYIYMCAKEDFSGTHRFAKTYDEHMVNAKRYADALNKKNIK